MSTISTLRTTLGAAIGSRLDTVPLPYTILAGVAFGWGALGLVLGQWLSAVALFWWGFVLVEWRHYKKLATVQAVFSKMGYAVTKKAHESLADHDRLDDDDRIHLAAVLTADDGRRVAVVVEQLPADAVVMDKEDEA